MATAARKMTRADLEKLPADGFRHEIIEGEEFMTPAPLLSHQSVVLNIAALLRAFVVPHSLGHVFVSPADVLFSEHTLVQPDVLFVAANGLARLTEKCVEGPPDLVVEVLSASTAAQDRKEKLELYSRSGVREYWIADPATRTIEVREFGSPRRTRVFQDGQSFEPAVLPGLTVPLSEVFRL